MVASPGIKDPGPSAEWWVREVSYNIELSDRDVGVSVARPAGAVISSDIYLIFRLVILIILILI